MSGPPAVRLTRRQVVDFRVARHGLERLGPDGTEAAAVVGLQDTPPGTAALSLSARADIAPDALDALVLVPSVRGAPLAVAKRDLAVFTAGLDPPDEEAARALVGNAWKSLEGITAMDALDRVSEAVQDSLGDGPRPRDEFHQRLRERLPAELLWWCKGCGSHHVHPSLWRATGIRGVLAIVGREGRSAVFGLPPHARPIGDPGAELARRFLRAYGPARPKLFAGWAGGVRLLANLDPLNAARDRELQVPDSAVRKRIWTAMGGPGTVLVDGEVAGLWRPAMKGGRLLVTVEPLSDLTGAVEDELAAEADRIAPFRGADTGVLRLAAV